VGHSPQHPTTRSRRSAAAPWSAVAISSDENAFLERARKRHAINTFAY